MGLELRKYQRDAIDSIYKYFEDGGTGNPIVVAPTGSGKSILIAKFTQEILAKWPDQRILIVAHRKELLQQNCNKLLALWPEAPVGLYSAGLRQKKLNRKITIAGIQSIFRHARELGWIDLVIIDEAHLTPPDGDGQYQRLLNGLLETNKNVKIVGLTATPFRLKTGYLVDDGGFFTDICFDIRMTDLIEQGYLSPLISKMPTTQADLSGVAVRGGEYVAGELEAAMDLEDLTRRAIDEMQRLGGDRRSWLIFCSGVDHANHVARALRARGLTAEAVTGESENLFRATHIEAFKTGTLQCLVGADIFTTGFDAPNIDMLVLLRATKSVGLYCQMVGRASRLSPETGKQNALILDFAQNIERHGPVDAVKIVRRPGGGGKDSNEVQTAPVKICPSCREPVLIREMVCKTCGYEFPQEKKHETTASERPILSTHVRPSVFSVENVRYARHEKAGKPCSLRVFYDCEAEGGGNLNSRTVSEWVCFEHMGFAFTKAVQWWKNHHQSHKTPELIDVPRTVNEALQRVDELRPVSKIYVSKDGNFDRILSVAFATQEEARKKEADMMDLLCIGDKVREDSPDTFAIKAPIQELPKKAEWFDDDDAPF